MAELNIKFVPPVPAYFTATLDRGAVFDLIVTLTAAVEMIEVPDSIPALLATLVEVYDGDLPSGVSAPLDGDAAAA